MLAYIQYLHKHWTVLREWIDRHSHDRWNDVNGISDIDYVEFIAERFKYEDAVFDVQRLDDDEVGTKFMSDLISDKKNISYVISTRNIGKVRAILGHKPAEANPTLNIETEPFYKTKFIDLPMLDDFPVPSTVLQRPPYKFEIKKNQN